MKHSLDQSTLTITKHIKFVSLLSLLIVLNACSLLPFTESEVETKSIVEHVDLYEQEAVQSDISLLREELDSFRPSVVRLIELESELRELLDVVNSTGEQNFYLPSGNQALTDFSHTANQDLNSSEAVSLQGSEIPASVSNTDDKFSTVQVNAANELSGELFDKSTVVVDKTKAQLRSPQNSNDSKMLDKFSSQVRVEKNNCSTIDKGQGFALHIASYKVRSSAENTLQDVVGKMNKPGECSKSAMIAEVTVKNQNFFSARIGSYTTKEDAKIACGQIKSLTGYCAVTQNIGTTL